MYFDFDFVRNVSIRLRISDVWQECFYLMNGNLEVYCDKNHSGIHAMAQLPKITLQTRLSGDMID